MAKGVGEIAHWMGYRKPMVYNKCLNEKRWRVMNKSVSMKLMIPSNVAQVTKHALNFPPMSEFAAAILPRVSIVMILG